MTTMTISPASRMSRLFLGVAFVCLGWCALSVIDAKVFDLYGRYRLSRKIDTFGLKGSGVAQRARSEAKTSGVIGRIEIPRVQVSAIIAEGSREATLRHAVGHLSDSVFPGERGNVALAGHRETMFRGLRHLRPKDRIIITTPDGVFDYRVEWTRVVEPNDLEVLRDGKDSALTLLTCYPFDYIGPAPKRFVVRARQISPS